MPATGARLIGISEVGHVTDPEGTPVDVPWGNTQQEGVSLQLATDSVDLQSAQAKMREDNTLVSADIQLVINLIVAELQALQRAWGLPVSALVGDHSSATPTEEVLTITEGNLGTREDTLYVLGPGPASTRRVEVGRAKVADIGNLEFASNGYTLPSATWSVLNPGDGSTLEPLVITDAL